MMNRKSIAFTAACLGYVLYAQINEYLKKRAFAPPQIKINETEYPSDLYTEFEVDKKGILGTAFDTWFYFLRLNDHLLKISLNNPTNSKQHLLFWRSDKNNPNKVHQNGGLHPYQELHESENLMVTKDKITANACGEILSSSKNPYFRYMVHPKQVSPVSADDAIGIDAKNEGRVPGSIDSNEIVSFRKCVSSSLCSSIFVSNKFIKKHPSALVKVLNANLARDEAVKKFKMS